MLVLLVLERGCPAACMLSWPGYRVAFCVQVRGALGILCHAQALDDQAASEGRVAPPPLDH